MKNSRQVIIILGPSGVGKSELALALARELKSEIISADARQIYRGMDIGTGKPPLELRTEIKHYLIDIVEPDEDFDAAKFKKLADATIEEIFKKGKIPIVVGGSGFYIRALTQGICLTPPKDRKLRENLEGLTQAKGKDYLYQRLMKIDPEAAERIHSHDLRRIIRALEVYEQTGLPLSQIQTQSQNSENRFKFIKIGLLRPRKELYKQAEERIKKMFQQGWIDEVKTLLDKGYQPELPALHALGYREISQVILGQISLVRAQSLIKQKTRHFIKRQLTWFKKEKNIHWVMIEKEQSNKETLNEVKKILQDKGLKI